MKKIVIYLVCALMVMGCKKVNVDFSFSPAEPKAGETVKFTNSSSAGESWTWTFGDNSTSLLKNPTKVYKKPGTYLVTLVVDSAKYNTRSHSITVYDTVPTFVSSLDSILHCQDVKFTANIYNPFGYELLYQWTLPENCILSSGKLTDNSIVVYFKNPTKNNELKTVQLTITQGQTVLPTISRGFVVYETQAPAIVMKCKDHIYRQRIINDRLDSVVYSQLEEDMLLFSNATDTSVIFNDSVFNIHNMKHIFPEYDVLRLQIDAMTQKWYITTAEGLYVANFNGKDVQLIDSEATGAIYVDAERNQIYWATRSGLKVMPVIKSKNNQFSTTPILCNNLSDIDRIVVNNKYR